MKLVIPTTTWYECPPLERNMMIMIMVNKNTDDVDSIFFVFFFFFFWGGEQHFCPNLSSFSQCLIFYGDTFLWHRVGGKQCLYSDVWHTTEGGRDILINSVCYNTFVMHYKMEIKIKLSLELSIGIGKLADGELSMTVRIC